MAATTEEFLNHAAGLRADVERALDRYTAYDDDCPRLLRDAIRHSLLAPAKRLRPLLVLMAADACGSNQAGRVATEIDDASVMAAACSVEMVHTYSLIHDDLPAMDDDDLRRGLPTCHAVYGEALGILAGDALLAQAFEVLARDIRPPEVAAACCAALGRAAGASALVGGQADDLQAEQTGGGPELLERIHRRKTGAMFLVSLQLGGLVARADARQLADLDEFGRALGLAFQIVDDLLDVKGDEAALGKRVQKDSERGKLTFPALWGIDASWHRAEQLVEHACRALQTWGPRGRWLTALARYVLERNR